MEKDRQNYHQAKDEANDQSIQPATTIDDMLLEMISTEAKLKMTIDQLKVDIEDSLATFDKDKFIESTSRLNKLEIIYES
jgi:DNA-binding SARP family transcriptional activator